MRSTDNSSNPESPTGSRRARPQPSVFDRLTDTSHFTGIHKARVADEQGKDEDEKEKKRPLKRPKTAPLQQDTSVFSRLADSSAFTGVIKVKALEAQAMKNKGSSGGGSGTFGDAASAAAAADANAAAGNGANGGNNSNAVTPQQQLERARSLSSIEKDFDQLHDTWAQLQPKPKKPESSGSGTPSMGGASGDVETPVRKQRPSPIVTSPIDKATAINAVKKLNSIFDALARRGPLMPVDASAGSSEAKDHLVNEYAARLNGSADPTSPSARSDASGSSHRGMSLSSPAPKAADILNALSVMVNDNSGGGSS